MVWQVIQRGYFIHELLCCSAFGTTTFQSSWHWNFTQFNCLHGVPACPSCPRSGTTQRTSVRQGLGIFSGDTWVVYGCVSHVLNRFCAPRFLPLHKSFQGDSGGPHDDFVFRTPLMWRSIWCSACAAISSTSNLKASGSSANDCRDGQDHVETINARCGSNYFEIFECVLRHQESHSMV